MNTNCCYQCVRRSAGCHGKCADYATYKTQLATSKESKARDYDRMMRCYDVDLARRVNGTSR